MVAWEDEGIILSCSRYGESGLRVGLFCQKNGKHAGFLRGYGKSLPQMGNIVKANWQARLSEQLGKWKFRPDEEVFAHLVGNQKLLLLMQSALALLWQGTAEQDPMESLYNATKELLLYFRHEDDYQLASIVYLKWEIAFLSHSGFGLDLSKCALSGDVDNLRFISPKTGRAITSSAANGKPWQDKLLPLPFFLSPNYAMNNHDANHADNLKQALAEGFRLTEFFLEKQFQLLPRNSQTLPAIRRNLLKELDLDE